MMSQVPACRILVACQKCVRSWYFAWGLTEAGSGM